jgi:molybdopterin/thiamine biosynthesis adenylyltransferase
MNATLVLPDDISKALREAALLPVETAGVLLAGALLTQDGDIRLLARKMHWVPDASYIRREGDSLSIASDGYVPFLGEAETTNSMAIWVHTHPGLHGLPRASTHDQIVDRQLADLFRLRSGSPYYGALILSPRGGEAVAFTGQVRHEDGETFPIGRMWSVGERLRLTQAHGLPAAAVAPIFDRSVRAFGGPIQHALGDLRVGLVGCGGTGSAVAEQLVRLGVRHLVLFDPDHLSASNVTRVYGSSPADVGQAKVAVLGAHLRRIAPEIQCTLVPSMVTTEPTARRLLSCDVVFGCTDDNAGRLILSRLATYLMTPVIDCGILLSSTPDGQLVGIDGRVTTLVPGQACLVCRGRIDLRRAATELLTPDERKRRADEGYAPALPGVEPAVVTFTTMVGAAAVSELLERMIGYGPDPRPSEVLLRCHDRAISTNIALPTVGHYCHNGSGKLGLGATTPFLEQTWPG